MKKYHKWSWTQNLKRMPRWYVEVLAKQCEDEYGDKEELKDPCSSELNPSRQKEENQYPPL